VRKEKSIKCRYWRRFKRVTAEHEVVWVRRSRKGNEDMGSLLPFVPSDPSIYWSQDTHPQGIKENQL